jgi:hypothetical protein
MFTDVFTRVKVRENRSFEGVVQDGAGGSFFDAGQFRRTRDSADAIGVSRKLLLLSFRLT